LSESYVLAWREYRKRQILAISAMVAFIVVPLGVGWLTIAGYWRDLTIGLLYVVLLISVFVFGLRLAFWPCPRCRKPFRGFSDRCHHCGLALWSQGESG
jgi:hypothetical protein